MLTPTPRADACAIARRQRVTMWHEDRLLVDGELVAAENGATYETISPATEAVLGTAADASVVDRKAELPQRALHGLALRVEDPGLRPDEDRRLHPSTTSGSAR